MDTPHCIKGTIRPLPMLLILLACLLGQPAASAEETDADLRPFVPAGYDPVQNGLSPRPLVAQALGLAMYVPEAEIVSDRAAGQMVLVLNDPAASPAWSVTIQHLFVEAGSTPESQIRNHIQALSAAGRQFQIIENVDMPVGNTSGRLCYIRQTVNAEENESIISGWLILPAGQDAMLVFSILAMPEALPFVRTSLDAAFQTINLRPVAELSLERRSRMDAGRSLLASLTPERLQTLIDTRQWSRIYRTDRDGREREVGYALLEVYEAKRGALNPERPESSYSRSEQADGIMVRLQGRVIGDAERRIFYDSIALYWMAWDQSEEAWNVRGTQRQGQAERSESETGLRIDASVGNPLPTLTVIRQRSADFQRDPYEWSVPEVYLSQALAAVLGRLLPRDADRAREYSYYFYNYGQAVPQLTQRTDRWERSDDGNWTLTTRLSADSPPVVSQYSQTGQFIRTVRPDGSITEPSTIERIRQLWMRQGLPMGD